MSRHFISYGLLRQCGMGVTEIQGGSRKLQRQLDENLTFQQNGVQDSETLNLNVITMSGHNSYHLTLRTSDGVNDHLLFS